MIPINTKIFFPKLSFIAVLVFFSTLLNSCSHKILPASDNAKVTDSIVSKPKDKKVEFVQPKDDYFKSDFFRYEDYIYDQNIKTVLLRLNEWELSAPVIKLKTEEKLKLSFDDFSENTKNYKYTIIHCSANWTPSDLLPTDYIDGFTDDNITSYQYSLNTIQKYIHYDLVFPTENLRITKSGNYIIKVYIEGNPENPVITRRFMVTNPLVTITTTIKRATVLEARDAKQEIDFTINSGAYSVENAFSNLTIVLMQNDRFDNIINTLKPQYVRGNELVYDFEEGNTFTGGSEFRKFDMKSIKYLALHIKKIIFDTAYQVYLLPDAKRQFMVYNSDKDINGKRFIKTEDGTNSDTEAEYAYVHFTLPYDAPTIDGDVYVFGSLTDWSFPKEAKMKYDYNERAYKASLYLKQGYYNYEYVFLKTGEKAADESFIEGSHWETENDYSIYVYYRQPGTLYDQLIGSTKVNSTKK